MKKTPIAGCILLLSSIMAYAGLSDLEKKFLQEFANNDGNMGIGFVPEHTFDRGFRQVILNSKDEEVQKAFILSMLPREIESILDTLKSGKTMVGKGQYEKLSEDKRRSLIVRFNECMTLMEKLDAGKNKHFYSVYQSQLDNIVGKTKK
jgi:hypothetical protein